MLKDNKADTYDHMCLCVISIKLTKTNEIEELRAFVPPNLPILLPLAHSQP